jgi:hypothetical protein
MVEEYFYSADTGRQLEQKLIDAGFKNVGGSEYHIERALVLVQKIRSSDPVNDTCRLLPDDAPTEDWFLLGLYKLLSDFPKDSPLRKFFG